MRRILVYLLIGIGTALIVSAQVSATLFPLQVRMSYLKASPLVTVKGSAPPSTVVQARGASVVVPRTGFYALKTSMPVAVTAVRGRQIRRFRFTLPDKAKPYLEVLMVSADLERMWGNVSGQLTITEHATASIVVQHVEKGTTQTASLARGSFAIGIPLVQGTNTLKWWLKMGPLQFPGPDITFEVI